MPALQGKPRIDREEVVLHRSIWAKSRFPWILRSFKKYIVAWRTIWHPLRCGDGFQTLHYECFFELLHKAIVHAPACYTRRYMGENLRNASAGVFAYGPSCALPPTTYVPSCADRISASDTFPTQSSIPLSSMVMSCKRRLISTASSSSTDTLSVFAVRSPSKLLAFCTVSR